MLQSLHVKNLALIDEVEVEFSEGLNILTGETGAGKSIILGSINLALGGRYTGDILRTGAEFGFVELIFIVDNESHIQALRDLDIYLEDGMVILNRKLMPGRSVSKINGETVTQSILKLVADILIDIHGQHEHQSLLNKKKHLEILDEYIGEEGKKLRSETSSVYKEYKAKLKELEQADTDSESRKRELDFLQFELNEIQEANLLENEDEELELSYKKMTYGKRISQSIEEVYENTAGYGNVNASDSLSRSLQALQLVTEYDGACASFYEQLSEIDSLLNDFNREISSYKEDLQFSDEDFSVVEDRLNLWNHLKSKYGSSYENILAYQEIIENKIVKLEDYDTYLMNLNKEVDESKKKLEAIARELSKCRMEYSKGFCQEIILGLKELNFLDVKFEVEINPVFDSVNANGMDQVCFMVSLNPGESIKPLSSVVSGGELSRIMLVIKTVLSDKDQIDTMIFDEVDAGISGITATKVGEKLELIGQNRQVICITHLAQIAALAKKHFIIEKNVEDGSTKTKIESLNYEESINELSRILGGGQFSEAIVQSARELKKIVT